MRLARPIALLLAGLLATLPTLRAAAAPYPERPVRLIVPSAAGGAADFFSRILMVPLGQALGQPIVIENKAGASGTIGAGMVAKAPPDGLTLLMAQSTSVAIAPHLYRKVGYDTLTDFAPVSLVALVPNILVVHPQVPVTSVKELIALARSQPRTLNFASAGSGAPSHLAVLPHVKAGRLRAIALTSAQPSASVPGLPTIAQAGLPGYEISSWFGLFAPAGTPRDIVDRLQKETALIVRSPEIRERFALEGAEAVGDSPAEFSAFVRTEYARFEKLVKDAGIALE